MKMNKLWILCLLVFCSCGTKNEENIVSYGFERAEQQLSAQLKVNTRTYSSIRVPLKMEN